MADFGITVGPGAASWVFTPTTVATNTLKISNLGTSPLYAGPLAAVSTPGAFPAPVLAGAHLFLNPVTAATYLTAGFSAGTSTTTLSAASSTAGSTSFTVASNTAFPAGTVMLVGSAASSQEVLAVASTTSTTVITTTTASLYDHAASATVSTATGKWGQARVQTCAV